jgi:arylformamidase
MQIIDLTHPLSSDTQPYPGSPPNSIVDAADIDTDGYRVKLLGLTTHSGTHMDAPAHMLRDGKTLDEYPADQFYGSTLVIETLTSKADEISSDVLQQISRKSRPDFILFNTGWDKKYGRSEYYASFPFLSVKLAEILSQMELKGVGIDSPSVDPIDSRDFPVHQILMEKGLLILENICQLDKVGKMEFTLAAFPLKIADADGSPIRAMAILDEEI